jgi:hypothetical protein
MLEYVLKIATEVGVFDKRMFAENDSTAILAAIKWEDHNPDMQLFSDGRLVADKRHSLWCLRPDGIGASIPAKLRVVIDPFTRKLGWAGLPKGTSPRQPQRIRHRAAMKQGRNRTSAPTSSSFDLLHRP